MLYPISQNRLKKLEKKHNFQLISILTDDSVCINIFQSSKNPRSLFLSISVTSIGFNHSFLYRPVGFLLEHFILDLPFWYVRKHFIEQFNLFLVFHPELASKMFN